MGDGARLQGVFTAKQLQPALKGALETMRTILPQSEEQLHPLVASVDAGSDIFTGPDLYPGVLLPSSSVEKACRAAFWGDLSPKNNEQVENGEPRDPAEVKEFVLLSNNPGSGPLGHPGLCVEPRLPQGQGSTSFLGIMRQRPSTSKTLGSTSLGTGRLRIMQCRTARRSDSGGTVLYQWDGSEQRRLDETSA